jgi:arylsulfatase A-like enzyme/tetratricopeptide (TPR) repeat protein
LNRKRLSVLLAVAILVVAGLFLGFRHSRNNSASAPPCNVLLITLDTVRADHLGCYGYEPALTPALDALAAKGAMFEQAFSNVPMTLPSHATIMTGLLPPEHGVRVNGEQRLDIPKATLAEMLRGRGYQTGAFIAAVVLDHANGLDRGFDVYSDQVPEEFKQHCAEPLSAYRPGDVVTNDALAWLAQRDPNRPFFCWVHLFDPHMPYFAHEIMKGTKFENTASYDEEIAFTDIQVRRLTDYLAQQNLTERTVVIAFGDHGEGLGEHHEDAHGYMLYDSTLHVPLIVSLPGRVQPGIRVKSLVSLVDLFGTVLDLVGGGETEERSGRSLMGALIGREIPSVASYAETLMPLTAFSWSPLWSLTQPEWKYIRSSRLHLYDRPVDPGELNNLATERRGKVEEMEKALKSIEGEMVVHDAATVEMTSETIARLEALGYVSGGPRNFADQAIDYSSLREVDDVIHLIRELPRLRTMIKNNQNEELVGELRGILLQSPESVGFRSSLVSALIKTGRTEEALTEALECHKLKPSDHEMCQTIATTYLYLGKPVEAVPYFWEAIRLKPDFAPAHDELAKLLRGNGDLEAADRHSADTRAKLNKEAAEPYELGVVLAAKQRFDEAMEQFNEALRISPDDAVIHAGFARALEQKGDYAAAAQQYAEAVRLDPADPQKLGDFGKVLAKQGNYAESAQYLAKSLELKPEDVPVRTNLGLALARQGKLDEALVQFSEALRLAPNDGQVHLTKAGVLEENGRLAEAVAEYREAVRLNPDAPDWANHLAKILATHANAEFRDGAEAVRLAEQACSATGEKNAAFLDTLAAAYAEVGRFPDAVTTAKKALAIAREAQKADLVPEIQQRIELYENSKPYHAAPK